VPFERETEHLRLRRPVPEDLDGFVALHTDPRTYVHAPASMPTEQQCRERLTSYLLDWDEFGFGYLAVEELGSDRLVGWGGVRLTASPRTLNLYYRLAHDALGHGYGRELVRAILDGVREELPDHTVRASVKRHNRASMATALGAGLVEVGEQANPEDGPEDPPSVILEARPVEEGQSPDGSALPPQTTTHTRSPSSGT
jgi:RimJ/RimL family protein N-acetyltransferase